MENSPKRKEEGAAKSAQKAERIAKVMARAGLCSRREAERWIADGRVEINGTLIDTPATLVQSGDHVVVDGKALPAPSQTRLFIYHKPTGLVTTSKDEQGRKTVFDALPKGLPRLISVGRLDMNTEGLLLLTTDGALSRYLELPATALKRTYRVRVLGLVTQSRLDKLSNGLTHEGVRYGAIEATLEKNEREKSANAWITLSIREGKNREVRKIMEALGLQVNRLIRTSYGPFMLDDLAQGKVVEVNAGDLQQKLPDFFKTGNKEGRA